MRLDRLLAITMALLNQKRVTAFELADRFEVSVRTIYRDMDTLNQAGIPIASYQGTDGGFEIMSGYRLEKQYLALEDIQSLISALRGAQSATNDEELERLIERVHTLVSAEPGSFSKPPHISLNYSPRETEKARLKLLLQAIRTNRSIFLNYIDIDGTETSRNVEPLGLFLKGRAWYMYGYCLLRSDYRIFRLTRMDRVNITQEQFPAHSFSIKDAEEKWKNHLAPLTYKAVLKFSPPAKSRVLDDFDPSETELLHDGSILVTTFFANEERAVLQVLGYGRDVRVIAPSSLQSAMLTHLQAMLEYYLEPRSF